MAELALAASVIQIAGVAADLFVGLYKVGAALGHAGTEVRLIANEISSTSQVLIHLGNILKSQSRRQPEARRIAEQHLAICNRLFEESKALLRVLSPLVERSGRRRTRNFGLRLRWLFERSKFTLHRQSLESLKLSLNLLLTSMNYVEASRNQVSDDTFSSLRKQLQMAISLAEASTAVSTISLQITGSQASGGTQLLLMESDGSDTKDSESSGGAVTPEMSTARESEDIPQEIEDDDNYSEMEMAELSMERKNTGTRGTSVSGSVGETETFEEFGIGDNSQASILYIDLMHLAQDTATRAKRILEQTSETQSDRPMEQAERHQSPKFAWICSTHLSYIAACLALDAEFEVDPEISWMHDATLTFGSIRRNYVVIMYHPLDGSDKGQSTRVLQDTLRRRFDSIEQVLIVGTGGTPFKIADLFDIRLGDVVVGETTSMGAITPGVLASRQNLKFSLKPTTWWVLQAILKHKWTRIRGYDLGSTNMGGRLRGAGLSKTYERPSDDSDLLFPRGIIHVGDAYDCSDCVGAHPRPFREPSRFAGREDIDGRSHTHYGNTFIYTGEKIQDEIKGLNTLLKGVSAPTAFTRNGPGVVEEFPCIVICGVSSYLDSHVQSKWENYAELKAAIYAMELIAIM